MAQKQERKKKTTVTVSNDTYKSLVEIKDRMRESMGIDRIVDSKTSFDSVITMLINHYNSSKKEINDLSTAVSVT